MTQVAVFMGSKSDEGVIRPCVEVLEKLGISHVFTVTSAHRTPERTSRLVRELEEDGVQVFICAAGLAAHLLKCRNAAFHVIRISLIYSDRKSVV